MTEQPSTSRRSVALAAAFVVLAVASFAAAFYLLGGEDYVQPLVEQVRALVSPEPAGPAVGEPTESPAQKLVLPAGMTEEFALRLWQEQVDSQPMIEQLVAGEVSSLKIKKVEKVGDEARLKVTVILKDGGSAPGTIGLRRFGDNWYVAYAAADSDGSKPGPGDSELPSVNDIDVALLNTMLTEQTKSQSTIDEYLAGIVREVLVEDVEPGPNTVTMNVEMDETHGDGYAKLVAIQSDAGATPAWFLARFAKTGDETTTAQ